MGDLRVKFEKGEQRSFLDFVKNNLECKSITELHKKCSNISLRSFKNYYSEHCAMPSSLFYSLCSLSKIDSNKQRVTFLPRNWGQVKAGKISMKILQEKYKDKFHLWRKIANKNSVLTHLKKINYPKLDEELAEFIGAYLGDGTITEHLIKISGDSRYDSRYFDYLSSLVKKLFNIDSKVEKRKDTNELTLIIRSKNICSFLRDKYSIQFGDKIRNQTCIPKEILDNKKLALACLRGLVDTDGCISRRGRRGSQFCVQFFNGNKKLLEQVKEMGFRYGFFSYSTGGETGTNSWDKIKRYFEEVGSSNMKHIVRFNVKLQENKVLYLREVLEYYKKPLYKNIQLPFKI